MVYWFSDGTSSSMRGGWGVHTATFGGGFPSTDNSASAKSARRAGCTKLHVASLPENCQSAELRRMFERYGYVAECDVVEDRNIAFVHIEDSAAEAAIHGLNGFGLRGTQIKVQLSKNQSNQGAHSGGLGGADRGFMRGQQGRVGMMGRGGGRLGGYPPNARPGYNEMTSEAERSFGPNGDSSFESALPPPAKDRLELLELLDRRRRLEALDPYERRLIACPDPFNLPPPPPEYLRLVRERSLVRARLPLPPSSTVLGRSLPTAGSTTSSSALARALVARRAAASAAQVKQDHLHAAGAGLEPYADPKALSYANMYASEY